MSQRDEDPVCPSTELRTHQGGRFLSQISSVQNLVDAILSITAKNQYLLASQAMNDIKHGNILGRDHTNVFKWSSVFSGLQVIVNRITLPHHDSKSYITDYDLLVSAGTHASAWLTLHDIRTRFSYNPGTVVLVCGRVLLHEVDDWNGSDRICIAHYTCQAIHCWLGITTHSWVDLNSYVPFLSSRYRARCVVSCRT